jgi:hypothetical protein
MDVPSSEHAGTDLALWRDEVRILIFDDLAEQRTGNARYVDPGRVNCQTRAGATPRAMHEFSPENLRKPARVRHVGSVRQFSTSQVNSTAQKTVL